MGQRVDQGERVGPASGNHYLTQSRRTPNETHEEIGDDNVTSELSSNRLCGRTHACGLKLATLTLERHRVFAPGLAHPMRGVGTHIGQHFSEVTRNSDMIFKNS